MKKEEELNRCKEDFIYFVENHLNVRDADGNIVELKLTKFQKNLIDAILRKGFMNMRTMYITKEGQKK